MFKSNLQIATQQFSCIFFLGGGGFNRKVKFDDYKEVRYTLLKQFAGLVNITVKLKFGKLRSQNKIGKKPTCMCFYCF